MGFFISIDPFILLTLKTFFQFLFESTISCRVQKKHYIKNTPYIYGTLILVIISRLEDAPVILIGKLLVKEFTDFGNGYKIARGAENDDASRSPMRSAA